MNHEVPHVSQIQPHASGAERPYANDAAVLSAGTVIPHQLRPEGAPHIPHSGESLPQPESSQSDWLRSRLGEVATWKSEEQSKLAAFSTEERAKNPVWAHAVDIPSRIPEMAAGNNESAKIVNSYLRKADPAELAGPDYDALYANWGPRQYYLTPAVVNAAKRIRLEGGELRPEEKKIIFKTFESLGFASHQAKEIWKSWRSYETEYSRYDEEQKRIPDGKKIGDISEKKVKIYGEILFTNLNNMNLIHDTDPKALQTLFKRDHIRNFGRYNPFMLLEQVDSTPDQVFVAMADDYNNSAASLMSSMYDLTTNAITLKSNKKTHIKEAATGAELRGLLEAAAAETGPLKDVGLDVHANARTLAFSHRPGGIVTIEDIVGDKNTPPLLDNTLISKGANMMIIGCDAGAKKGIAAVIANKLKVRMRAPDIKTTGLKRSKNFGLLRSRDEKNQLHRIPTYGVNPVSALAHRIKTAREHRKNGKLQS